jgi:nucleoid-associated protein YgaU
MKRVFLKGFIIVLIGSFLLTACGLGNASLPTLVPNAINSSGGSGGDGDLDRLMDESPRAGLAAGLPPTWTPGAPEAETETPQPVSTVETVETVEPVIEETNIYVVQSGDTLAEIAESFSLTLEQLASANNIEDVDHIETGQELLIPAP